jgi:hypothetical protein
MSRLENIVPLPTLRLERNKKRCKTIFKIDKQAHYPKEGTNKTDFSGSSEE